MRREVLETLAEVRAILLNAIREINKIGGKNRPAGEQRRLERALALINQRISETMRFKSSRPMNQLDGPSLSDTEQQSLKHALAKVSEGARKSSSAPREQMIALAENATRISTAENMGNQSEMSNAAANQAPESQARIELLSVVYRQSEWIDRPDDGAGASNSLMPQQPEVFPQTEGETLLDVLRESPERQTADAEEYLGRQTPESSADSDIYSDDDWSDCSDPEIRALLDMSTLFTARRESNETLLDRQERREHERTLQKCLQSPQIESPLE